MFAGSVNAQRYARDMKTPSAESMRDMPAVNASGRSIVTHHGVPDAAPPAARMSSDTSVAVSNPRPNSSPTGYMCHGRVTRRRAGPSRRVSAPVGRPGSSPVPPAPPAASAPATPSGRRRTRSTSERRVTRLITASTSSITPENAAPHTPRACRTGESSVSPAHSTDTATSAAAATTTVE